MRRSASPAVLRPSGCGRLCPNSTVIPVTCGEARERRRCTRSSRSQTHGPLLWTTILCTTHTCVIPRHHRDPHVIHRASSTAFPTYPQVPVKFFRSSSHTCGQTGGEGGEVRAPSCGRIGLICGEPHDGGCRRPPHMHSPSERTSPRRAQPLPAQRRAGGGYPQNPQHLLTLLPFPDPFDRQQSGFRPRRRPRSPRRDAACTRCAGRRDRRNHISWWTSSVRWPRGSADR